MAGLRRRLRAAYQALTGPRSRASLSTYHEAAGNTRRLKHWDPTAADISTIASMSGDMLLRRARHLVGADGYAANAKEEWTSALVGTGIRPAVTLEDQTQRDAVRTLWTRWVDEADTEGQLDLYGIQDVVAGALFDAGEIFVRLRHRRPSDGLSVPLQLQLLEAEFLDRSYHQALPNGYQIKAGIEFDAIGRRAAYHFWSSHPGDQLLAAASAVRRRVPADQVLHVYQVTRPGQIRGLPALVPALVRLKLLSDYDDAELDRKRVAALVAGFIESPEAFGEGNEFTTETPVDGEEGVAQADWVPGSLLTLRPGEKVSFSEPADVGSSYETFQHRNLLAIAAACGVPYSALSADVSRANYSSLRAAMLMHRRRVHRIQRKTLIYQLCRPIWARFIDSALLAGALRGNPDQLRPAVTWIPPKWEWVDPLKDAEACKVMRAQGW
jgi:lambda family phage portal protein